MLTSVGVPRIGQDPQVRAIDPKDIEQRAAPDQGRERNLSMIGRHGGSADHLCVRRAPQVDRFAAGQLSEMLPASDRRGVDNDVPAETRKESGSVRKSDLRR